MLRYIEKVVASLDTTFSESYLFLRLVYGLGTVLLFSNTIELWQDWVTYRPTKMVEIIFWFQYLPFPQSEIVLMVLSTIIGVATLIFIQSQALRALFFIFSLISLARGQVVEDVIHNFHFILYLEFFLIWIPSNAWRDFTKNKKIIITCIHAGIISASLNYTFAGLYKIGHGFLQLFTHHDGIFSSLNAACWLIVTDAALTTKISLMGNLCISHPYFFYFSFMMAIFFEISAVYWAFRPKYHMLLAFMVIAFNLATGITINIYFFEAFVTMTLVLLLSPLREGRGSKHGGINHAVE